MADTATPGPESTPPKKKKFGRPLLSPTPELKKAVVKLLTQGHFREVVFACFSGDPHKVSMRTFKRWIVKGKAERKGPFHDFWHAILKAEADAEMKQVDRIFKASVKDPKNAQWYLERKFPKRWGANKGEVLRLQKLVRLHEKVAENGSVATNAAHGEASKVAPTTGGEAKADAI